MGVCWVIMVVCLVLYCRASYFRRCGLCCHCCSRRYYYCLLFLLVWEGSVLPTAGCVGRLASVVAGSLVVFCVVSSC
ncbi:hypothetical protein RND81_02G231300 [Saponaria officinalis]|uniref:Secreted peptide n=1 Tax=Saponaria officinalis TaxID=3572 RepID=A0AAW1MX57_SAPOF